MDRSWLRAWVWAITLAAVLVVGYEAFWRAEGYVPSVQDDMDLWSIERDKIARHPDAVALLGASRTIFFVDPAQLSRELDGRPVAMLAVNGRYPLAVLRDLALDSDFRGLAVVSIDSRGFSPELWEMQRDYVQHYRVRWSLARELHRRLLTPLQENFVLMRSQFALVNVVKRWMAGYGLPINEHMIFRADRVGFVDYRHPGLDTLRQARVDGLAEWYRDHPAAPPETWLRDLAPVSEWVDEIQARGGRVVFFRSPASDGSLDLDETNFPRDLYWDRYRATSKAVMIDFRDEPEYLTFELPETSHIDGRDVPRFTHVFAQMLRGLK